MTVASVQNLDVPAAAEAPATSGVRVVVELTAQGDDAARVATWLTRALSTLAAECRTLDLRVGADQRTDSQLTATVIPLPHPAPRGRSRSRLQIHAPSRRVLRDGVPVELTRLEYDLLLFLCEHPGQVHERDVLLRNVWGYAGPDRSRTLDVHVRRLRRKIGSDLPLIGTVRGVGYRLEHGADVSVEYQPTEIVAGTDHAVGAPPA